MSEHRVITLVAALGALALIASTPLRAEIFRCTDPETGKTTFSDRACPDRSRGDSVQVGGPGGSSGEAGPANGSSSARKSVAGQGATTGPGKYIDQARSAEKGRADTASSGIERKID